MGRNSNPKPCVWLRFRRYPKVRRGFCGCLLWWLRLCRLRFCSKSWKVCQWLFARLQLRLWWRLGRGHRHHLPHANRSSQNALARFRWTSYRFCHRWKCCCRRTSKSICPSPKCLPMRPLRGKCLPSSNHRPRTHKYSDRQSGNHRGWILSPTNTQPKPCPRHWQCPDPMDLWWFPRHRYSRIQGGLGCCCAIDGSFSNPQSTPCSLSNAAKSKSTSMRDHWTTRNGHDWQSVGWLDCGAKIGSTTLRPCRPCPWAHLGDLSWLVEQRLRTRNGWRLPIEKSCDCSLINKIIGVRIMVAILPDSGGSRHLKSIYTIWVWTSFWLYRPHKSKWPVNISKSEINQWQMFQFCEQIWEISVTQDKSVPAC